MMEGRVCLVTGSTSGIGKEIAAGLAKMGATVVLAGRSRDRCEAAVQVIAARGVPSSLLSYIVADFSSQESVRRLAKEFIDNHDKLHVLVNNAGVFMQKRELTADGIERTLAVNHLAPFLLTNLLLDRLKAGAPSRIITTSSIAHKGAKMDFDDLQMSKSYGGIRAYGQSKLANILFTRELARRLQGTGVTANCFHPGAVRTNLVRGSGYGLVWGAASVFFTSPEKGADTAVYLASSGEVEGVSGEYFVKRKQARASDPAYDCDAAERLWSASEKLTGLA
ncbi:MAG: SDR family oxidoreductase [Nitrososphaera sp.]|jgi:NAD(P)-dependent dehydrogenase (short-subunit alcohol dehydrogenase family)